MLDQILDKKNRGWYNSAAAYQRHLNERLRLHRKNRDLAFADSIGSESIELFIQQGDGQVAALKHHGLVDGMLVYDLGCGCGRTARHSSAPDGAAATSARTSLRTSFRN